MRLLNLLRLAGVRVPSQTQNHEATYRELQDALLKQVARPAGVNGVQLDRILFNNYDDIVSTIRVGRERAGLAKHGASVPSRQQRRPAAWFGSEAR